MAKEIRLKKYSYTADNLYAVVESLLVILESGTDISTAIGSIADDTSNKSIRDVLRQISKDLNAGVKLWESFKKYKILPKRNIEIIKIGEENGLLLENLKNIVEQRRFEKELTTQLKSALIYPIIILLLGIAVAIGTVWFVLPRLTLVYSGLSLDLPWITEILIKIGEFISNVSIIYPLTVIISSLVIILLSMRYKPLKVVIEKLILKTPGVNRIVREFEISRMGMVLGGLLSVGVTIDRALLSLEESTPFELYKRKYHDLYNAITAGDSFRGFFKHYNDKYVVIPSTVRQMIRSSERSGNLPHMFTFLGEQYRHKVKTTTSNLTVILEPTMLIMLWIFVAIVALAIVLPIYTLIGSL